MSLKTHFGILLTLICILAAGAAAQAPDAAALIAAEKEAIKPLSYMFGVWRGPASTVMPDGTKHELIQTERIGPFLDGSVIVVEGRGYDIKTKAVSFNAFGTISFSPRTKKYTLHSYAQGQAGDFSIVPTADGYVWEIPAGPMTIRYTMALKNGVWNEVGDRIMPGKEPVRFFEMNLKRVGNTSWPAAGAIPMK
jgi:hypothetical protein